MLAAGLAGSAISPADDSYKLPEDPVLKELEPHINRYDGNEPIFVEQAMRELREVHADPEKRTRSDLAILLTMQYPAAAMVLHCQQDKYRKMGADAWIEARKLAEIPENTGERSELLSKELRRAGGIFSTLHQCGKSESKHCGGAFDPIVAMDNLKKAIEDHNQQFVGQESKIGKALLDEALAVVKTNKKKFEAKHQLQLRYDAYRKDPRKVRLDREWRRMERDAEAVARSAGVTGNWAHSHHPHLRPYIKKLTEFQRQDRKLRKEYRLDM
jgi:hypothetical protein